MNATSWNDFWAMGGYALYVWGSYGMVLAVMLAEPLSAYRSFHQARQQACDPTRSEP